MRKPDFRYEKKAWRRGFKYVAGVDEVGRGAWAGPIVAGAVVFAPAPQIKNLKFKIENSEVKIDDSKRLGPREREKAALWIKENALAWDVTEISVSAINKVGIGKATAKAMRKTLHDIKGKPPIATLLHGYVANDLFVLVDGFHVKYLPGGLKHQQAIIHGDQKSISIAAASIIAKVYRDKLMQRLSKKYPAYGWGKNKGYGTKFHQQAIVRSGVTVLHRKEFVKGILKDH